MSTTLEAIAAYNRQTMAAILASEGDCALGLMVRQMKEIEQLRREREDLPPMEPVDSEINTPANRKKWRAAAPKTKPTAKLALDSHCPTCGAEPDELCWYMTGPGRGATVDKTKGYKPRDQYHTKRGK